MKTKMLCKVCGKSFEYTFHGWEAKHQPRKYCSRKCVCIGNKKPLLSATCKMCGKKFLTIPWKPRRFCSTKCSYQQFRKEPLKLKCKMCGKVFESKRDTTIKGRRQFCSKKCRGNYLKGKRSSGWKGGQINRKCEQCGKDFLIYPYELKHAKHLFCSKKCADLFTIGKNRGNLNPCWKGGTTPLSQQIRTSFQYRQWRSDVFARDNYTCWECGKRGVKIHAHHVKSFAIIIAKYKIETLEQALVCEELWNINNGITLCEKCHHNYHKKHCKGKLT